MLGVSLVTILIKVSDFRIFDNQFAYKQGNPLKVWLYTINPLIWSGSNGLLSRY